MRTLPVVVLLLIVSPSWADEPTEKIVVGQKKLNEREQAFQKLLTGVKLTGSFTITGRPNPGAPKEESYEIQRLMKLSGDNWVILARAKWGENDVRLPFPVRVVWAEDTPMITLTNVGLPGLGGKFGCRVLFHGERYAGTWQHDAVGGHMFGTVTKLEPAPKEDTE